MSWRKITFIVVALIILLGGSAALSQLFISMKPEPRKRPGSEIQRSVKAEKIAYRAIKSSMVEKGRVVSGSEVMLVSEASGRIEQGGVVLRKGATFKKGQIIATIYKDEVELALKARKSRFLNLLTNILPDIKVDFPEAYQKYFDFFDAMEIDQPIGELPVTGNGKLKIFLASRNILSEYYGIKQDEKKLGRHTLYAPFSGAFTQVNFEVGAYVNPGGQIAKMIRTDKMEIEVPIISSQSQWVKVGDKVKVFSSGQAKPLNGVVTRKANFVDLNTQSRSVFVEITNSGSSDLLAGDYKRVEFPGQEMDGIMEMPRSAVFNSNEVFTVVDGRLKKREINIVKTNEKTLLFNGLEEGLTLVVEPLINVKENSPVGILGEEKPAQSKAQKGNRQVKS